MSCQRFRNIFPGYLLFPLACLYVHPHRWIFREASRTVCHGWKLIRQLLTAAYYTRTNRETKRVESLLRSFVYSSLQEQVRNETYFC
jgi:hypothetical protein